MSNSSIKTRPLPLGWLIGGLTSVCVSLPFGLDAFSTGASDELTGISHETEAVVKGRFVRNVAAVGDIRTFRPVVVFNDCRAYEREIIELIPEGTWVEKGDVVCVLDTADLQDKLREQEIELIKAEGSLSIARSRESLQEAANARNVDASRLQASLSQSKLVSYEEAESITKFDELAGQVRLSEDSFEQELEEFIHSQKLTSRGYRNFASRTNASARFQRFNRAVNVSRSKLAMLERFDHPRSLLELRSLATDTRKDVARAELQSSLELSLKAITTLEMQQWVAGAQRYVNYLTGAIDAATMRAPKAGEVVYCHKPDQKKFIEVGRQVHYTQDIVRIADRSRLTVAGRVSDRQVYSLREHQPVIIRIPTLPGEEFQGTLGWVAPIPTAANWYEPNVLHHKVQIILTDEPERLALLSLGASAEAQIIVDDRDDVVQVPVKAVFSHDDGFAVLVHEAGNLSLRVIQIGDRNREFVEVISGLSPGKQVVVDDRIALQQFAQSL